jgi:hypothetical protein
MGVCNKKVGDGNLKLQVTYLASYAMQLHPGYFINLRMQFKCVHCAYIHTEVRACLTFVDVSHC